ncbi:MAG: pyridoxal phosphate-dependent aminotransferase family protein [Vicingaceae bacterium]|nr:pyridoxal phosphate-dependent aminotransferase family protein [Vicingaceae bacterium]
MINHSIYIYNELKKKKDVNSYRQLSVKHDLIDFCSNDYLGFAKEASIHLINNNTETVQFGATGSRLISGNYELTEETETFLAHFYNTNAALIFNSGYNANIGLFQCLPQRNDTIIYDEFIHASIRDGIRLSNATHFSFTHNNLATLEQKLSNAKGLVYVVVESVYSMDGDFAPITEIVAICKKYNAALMVDEAHAVGIFGNGKGLVSELGLENDVFARITTFGKAFGVHGAAILGSNELRDYLINFSRAFIYTTALPLHSIISIKNAHEFLLQNLNRINTLKELINYFRSLTSNFEPQTLNSYSPIQCIVIPGNNEVKTMAEKLQQNGFDVRPILSPTVPKGQERLRICLHSFNSKEEVDNLINTLKI